jgi:hypothetical protein
MQFDGTMWEFFNKCPGNLQRFQSAIGAWAKLQPPVVDAVGRLFTFRFLISDELPLSRLRLVFTPRGLSDS